nr:hypothetical protein [Tanacetum cinerariifolium]
MAEKVIVAESDNHPPMLERSQYDSWQSRMLLYMQVAKEIWDRVILHIEVSTKNGIHQHRIFLMIATYHQSTQTSSNQKNQATTQDDRIDDLDAFDSSCDEAPSASVVLMAKLSTYDSYVLFDVPNYDTNHDNNVIVQSVQEMNEVVLDTSSSEQQDALIKSVIEKMSYQVAKCNAVNQENKIVNESLTTELERYKEMVNFFKERQKFDLNYCEKYIDSQMRVIDFEETLDLAEATRLKINEKQNDPYYEREKKSTNSTNELNVAYSVSTATSHSSQAQGSLSYTDELMFSFFANQSSSPQLGNKDLEKIDQDDLKEMDLKWLSVLSVIKERTLTEIAEQLGIQETEVKEKQENDKIRTKPDENGKRRKARQCQSPVTVKKAVKRRKYKF